jgi:hypothetical protein
MSQEVEAAEYLVSSTGSHRGVVEKAEGFVDVNTQVLDLSFGHDGRVEDSEGGMGGEAEGFVFAVTGEAVEEFRFAWFEGES